MAIKTANKRGYDMAFDGDGVDLAYPDSTTRRGRVGHGVSKTLPTSDSQGVIVGDDPYIVASRGRGEKGDIEQHLEPNFTGSTNTITSVQKDNYLATPYRIRKLTPKECYRLMGFDDASFDRASKVISRTQLYKTAGNSIVVPVLEAILKELLCK